MCDKASVRTSAVGVRQDPSSGVVVKLVSQIKHAGQRSCWFTDRYQLRFASQLWWLYDTWCRYTEGSCIRTFGVAGQTEAVHGALMDLQSFLGGHRKPKTHTNIQFYFFLVGILVSNSPHFERPCILVSNCELEKVHLKGHDYAEQKLVNLSFKSLLPTQSQ